MLRHLALLLLALLFCRPNYGAIAAVLEDELVPIVRLEPQGSSSVACSSEAAATASVHAILVGSQEFDDDGIFDLGGPHNDVELWSELLRRHNVSTNALLSPTREELFRTIHEMQQTVRCFDHLILYLGGHGALNDSGEEWTFPLRDSTYSRGGAPGGALSSGELAEVVLTFRNKGVSVAILVDAAFVAKANLLMPVQETLWAMAAEDLSTVGSGQILHPGAGDVALLFAPEIPFEVTLPNVTKDGAAKTYGLFSYSIAVSMLENPEQTIRSIAKNSIDFIKSKSEDYSSKDLPLFLASNPDMRLLGGGIIKNESFGQILINQPKTSAEFLEVEGQEIRLVGSVESEMTARRIIINEHSTEVKRDGSFEVTVPLVDAKTRLFFTAVGWDGIPIAQRTLEIARVDSMIPRPEGRFLAFVVANQNYLDERIEDLKTPIADAEAIVNALRTKFGFETVLDDQTDLVLYDATQREIGSTLHRLRQRLNADDYLLIFYAGHGDRLDGGDLAYWLPSDADSEDFTTWVSAGEITEMMRLMPAEHIMVISDSCFSGALTRAVMEDEVVSGSRPSYITRMSSRASRVLLSSGADEPVLDGGGKGHSVFVAALLAALDSVGHPVFTAADLYPWVKEMVAGRTDQSPQYVMVRESGHAGGDFVFWRKASPTKK